VNEGDLSSDMVDEANHPSVEIGHFFWAHNTIYIVLKFCTLIDYNI
jgi:hypothetical protein